MFFPYILLSPGVRSTQDNDGCFLPKLSRLSEVGGSSSTVVHNLGKSMDLSSLHVLLTSGDLSGGVVRHAQGRTRGRGRGIAVLEHMKMSDTSPL